MIDDYQGLVNKVIIQVAIMDHYPLDDFVGCFLGFTDGNSILQ